MGKIRRIVQRMEPKHLRKEDREAAKKRALEALDRLTRIREKIEAEHGISHRDFVAEARDGRDSDMDRVMKGRPRQRKKPRTA